MIQRINVIVKEQMKYILCFKTFSIVGISFPLRFSFPNDKNMSKYVIICSIQENMSVDKYDKKNWI